jgi:pyruvate kinase
MFIRTKIIATVGPATASLEQVRALARAGCDVFRINCSHGDESQWSSMLAHVRAVEEELGEPLAVVADLCGPKIRVRALPEVPWSLTPGQHISVVRSADEPGTPPAGCLTTTLDELTHEVEVGHGVVLDDGKIRLRVNEVTSHPQPRVECTVERGGTLLVGKGINLPHSTLALSALTEKDRRDLRWIAQQSIDYVALSFVRRAADVEELRQLLAAACPAELPHIIAKVEKPQAVALIDEIIDAADGVMVARGDLGVEMDLPRVPVAQKRIAHLSQKAGKPCIIATQMLETMTDAATPTRAEVSDVANAVLDATDGVMLSGETAMGRYPVAAVSMMNDIVSHIEAFHDETVRPAPVTYAAARTEAAMATAVRQIIEADDIAAVAVFTATGASARMLSKNRLARPILALSPQWTTLRRMALYYGVIPVLAQAPQHTRQVLDLAAKMMVERDMAREGERIVVLTGRPIGLPGATNTLVVHQIPRT